MELYLCVSDTIYVCVNYRATYCYVYIYLFISKIPFKFQQGTVAHKVY